MYQGAAVGAWQTSPLVVDGIMYLTVIGSRYCAFGFIDAWYLAATAISARSSDVVPYVVHVASRRHRVRADERQSCERVPEERAEALRRRAAGAASMPRPARPPDLPVCPIATTATSHSPVPTARAARAAWYTNDDPPTDSPSTNVGRIPRYSARPIGDMPAHPSGGDDQAVHVGQLQPCVRERLPRREEMVVELAHLRRERVVRDRGTDDARAFESVLQDLVQSSWAGSSVRYSGIGATVRTSRSPNSKWQPHP